MSDRELADSVRRAGGRVFIGFKEPRAPRGVDAKGRVLVSAATVAQTKAALRARGLAVEMEFQLTPTVVTRIRPELVPELRALPFIDNIEPLVPGKRLEQVVPWNVSRVSAPTVWSAGEPQVKVLIIDSGISATHEDLSWDELKRCAGAGDFDIDGHGTSVAGVVRALDNTLGVVGVSPTVALYIAKDGDAAPDPAGTACGVEWGRMQGVFVINISSSMNPFENLTNQITGAYNEGRLIVAAAGNTDCGAVTYPATLDEVIAVGATTIANARASVSACGPEVELVAPGRSVYTTELGGGYDSVSGTSFASPGVVGVAALIKSAFPSLTNTQVRERMNVTALDLGAAGRDNRFGYGLVSAGGAVGCAVDRPSSMSFDLYCGASVDFSPYNTSSPYRSFQGTPGTGSQGDITITFDAPLDAVSITALDPDFPNSRMIAYDGHDVARATVYFVPDYDPDIYTTSTRTVSAAPGGWQITKIVLDTDDADYVAYTDLRIARAGWGECPVSGPSVLHGGRFCGVEVSIAPYVTGTPFETFQSVEGAGPQSPLTLSFSGPVSSVSVRALGPDLPGNQIVAYDAGGNEIARVTFTSDNDPDVYTTSTKEVSGPGITRVVLVPDPADYIAYNDLRIRR